MWFGVQVPADAAPGPYEGAIRVCPKGEPEKRVSLRLEVGEKLLADAGDSEPWRHSRLRWLDSTIADDDEPAAPFTPLEIQGKKIALLGRDVELDVSGLPGSIHSYFAPEVTHLTTEGRPLLAGPIQFVMELPDGTSTAFSGEDFAFLKRSPGTAAWRSSSRAGDLRLRCRGELEFDGHATFSLEVAAERARPRCAICDWRFPCARGSALHDGHGTARRPATRRLPLALERKKPPGQRLAGRP